MSYTHILVHQNILLELTIHEQHGAFIIFLPTMAIAVTNNSFSLLPNILQTSEKKTVDIVMLNFNRGTLNMTSQSGNNTFNSATARLFGNIYVTISTFCASLYNSCCCNYFNNNNK